MGRFAVVAAVHRSWQQLSSTGGPMFTDDPHARHALRIIDRLGRAGFTAYLAGGCVRDALLGQMPKDFDVATNATPETVRAVFGRRRTLPIGAAFGVINVLPDRAEGGSPVEVATFRSDSQYSDGRRPDSVHFGDPEADAMRRDFTINGLFYDPDRQQVIDFVGGRDDLAAQRIRAIGDADQRLAEDKLRMLRAVRFAAVYDFQLDQPTADAIVQHAAEVTQTSGERIGGELRRLLSHAGAGRGWGLLRDLRLDRQILPPELAASIPLPDAQRLLAARPVHDFVSGLTAVLVLSGHRPPQPTGFEAALQAIAERWKLSTHERQAAAESIAALPTLLRADRLRWSKVQPVLAGRYAADALALAQAWCGAFGEGTTGVDLAAARLAWPAERFDPQPLIDGRTLQQMGLPPGPLYRTIIEAVRAAQLDGQISTTDEARALARQLADHSA